MLILKSINHCEYIMNISMYMRMMMTMAVIMIAGNQVKLPGALTDGVRTMTANIVLEMGYAADLHRGALIGTACVLFVSILVINFAFSALKRRGNNG